MFSELCFGTSPGIKLLATRVSPSNLVKFDIIPTENIYYTEIQVFRYFHIDTSENYF